MILINNIYIILYIIYIYTYSLYIYIRTHIIYNIYIHMAQTTAFEQKHSWGHLWQRLRLRHTLGRLLGCVAGGSCCSVMWPAGRFVWGSNFPFFGWWYMYLYLFMCIVMYTWHTYIYVYIYITCINENPPCFGPWPFWPKWSLAYGDHGSISQKITEDMGMIQLKLCWGYQS